MEESDYKLIRQVGAGVNGTVWAADGPSGRIAMRRFGSSAAAGSDEWLAEREQFLQGGRQSIPLRNPRIVSVLDVVDDGTEAWIASDFMSGETLEAMLTREKLPVEQSTYLLRLLALTLDYAHQAGVPHGDLKPSNVFIGEKRTLRVADFAISQRARRSPRGTMNPALIHPYISPEHLIAPASIGSRSDQYAMAAIAYHMYTGKAPFGAGDVGPAILRGQVAAPSTVNRALPHALDAVLLKGLSRDPGQRYPNCVEFIEQVEAALIPVHAAPVAAAVAAGGGSPKLMYAGLASLAVALLVAGGLMLSGRHNAVVPEKPRVEAKTEVTPPVDTPAPHQKVPKTKTVASSGGVGNAGSSNGDSGMTAGAALDNGGSRQSAPRGRSPEPEIREVVARTQPPSEVRRPEPAVQQPVARALPPADSGFTMTPPADAPNGYSIIVFSRDPKHRIANGISFSTKDPNLGEMGAGDLRAEVLLKGPGGKGKLTLEWSVDGTTTDGRQVNPNSISVFHNEPFPGNYHLTLRRDSTVIAEYQFRMTP